MAVRQIPILYKGSNSYSYNSLYWIYRSLQNSHEAWRSLAISFCVGLVLLAAWFVLRRERRAADQAIAKATFHIWTELRFLAVFLCLLCLTVPMLAAADGYNWWYPDVIPYAIMQTLRCFGAGLFNPGAALGLFWAVWFIRNDHHYHPAETRKSLYRTVSSALRKNELTYPIQKRINRRIAIRNLATVLAVLGSFALLYIYLETYDEIALLGMCAVWLVLGLLSSILWGRRERALARDFGLLADHVTAIQSGELTTPLDLPADADLRETAERLNSIQSGLKAAVAEQTRSERMKVELISNVSHDLKTPLTSITGFAELMKEGMVPKEKMQEFSGDIYRESRRLIDLVDDIIQLSRLDEGTANFAKTPVDLYVLAGGVIESLRPVAQRQNITLSLSGQHAVIQGVEQLLQEMVYNLCDNAIKYNVPGGNVAVSVWQNGPTTTLSVVDTGIGIPYADQSRVFERFYRVDKSHSKEVGGTGLGLSIVKHAAQYHGAKIELKSDPGKGTAIAVNFTAAK